MSDSDSSSSPLRSQCFCGRDVSATDGSIYCSVGKYTAHQATFRPCVDATACARSDAFSSLCYKPGTSPSSSTVLSHSASVPNIAAAADMPIDSLPLSRDPSDASISSASASQSAGEDWNASHYRRLARADARRDERREERKRRRAENSSISGSTSSARVPDLVGGAHAHSHSRNSSIASTASSVYTANSLSRNPSSASTASSRRYVNGINVDSVIMEDDNEEEWLSQQQIHEPKPYAPSGRKHRRRASNTGLSSGKLRQLEAFGMGKDMRDVLEEIIQMEKGFLCSDNEEHSEAPPPGLYTANFDRPPRTPSPMAIDKRQSIIPPAPGAPNRGHRMSMSHAALAGGMGGAQTPLRGPIPGGVISGHQSSLSESHTALYLATASPAGPERRSASPKLQARKSLTFTPDKAGPSIGALRPPRFESPVIGNTPSRRRVGLNSPSLHHPTMDGWKFPTSSSAAVTPTRPPPINTTNLPNNFITPTGNHAPYKDHARRQSRPRAGSEESAPPPQLLWPVASVASQPIQPPLAPALFPDSPMLDSTPSYNNRAREQAQELTLGSGVRLGGLLGNRPNSGSAMDVDMEAGSDEHFFANPHGFGQTLLRDRYLTPYGQVNQAERYLSSGSYPWAPEQP